MNRYIQVIRLALAAASILLVPQNGLAQDQMLVSGDDSQTGIMDIKPDSPMAKEEHTAKREILSMRTYDSKTYLDEETNSLTTVIYDGYVHYKAKSGRMEEINARLIVSEDSTHYQAVEGLYEAHFPFLITDQNQPIRFIADDTLSLAFRPVAMGYLNKKNGQFIPLYSAKGDMAEVSGNTIRYAEVFPGVDLEYEYKETKLEERILISQSARDNLPEPKEYDLQDNHVELVCLHSMDYPYQLDAFADDNPVFERKSILSLRHEGSSDVVFKDSENKERFSIQKDVAYCRPDKRDAETDSMLFLERRFYTQDSINYLMSGIPLKWLYKQPEGTIVVDPTITLTSAFADNFISSANPTTNYDASTNLAIGNYGGNNKRSIIQFNFTSIPKTAKITSAKLNAYFYGITGTSTSRTINCHRILPSWLKTAVTWNKRNGSTNWAVAGLGITNNDATDTLYATPVTLTTNYGWTEFRIDSLAARWIRGVYNNYGLLLRATNEGTSGDEKLFYSSEHATVSMRPKLEIVYTIDPLVEYNLYDSESKPLKVTYANGMTEYNTYNAYRGWLTERKYVWTSSGTEISKVQNDNIDLVGNITHQNATHNPASSKQYTYQYDSLYRLTSFKDGSTTIKSYSYDRNGNFLNMTGYATAFDSPSANSPNNRLTCNGKPTGDTTRIVYAYDTSGRVNSISRYVSGTLTNFPIGYDAFNNMRTYSSESYYYDHEGVRTKKINGSTSTCYVTNGLTVYAEYDGSNNCTNEYVYGLNGMVAALNPAKGYSWFTKDHLGNTRDVVDNNSSALMRDYCPFGQDYVAAGSVTNYLFTGKEVDNYSRLYYFGARYYDPAMGRWLAPDPLANKYPNFTPYNYCFNNPLRIIDPTGKEGEDNDEKKRERTEGQQNNIQITGNIKVAMDIADAVKQSAEIVVDKAQQTIEEGEQLANSIVTRTDKITAEVKYGKEVFGLGAEGKLQVSTKGDVIVGGSLTGEVGNINYLKAEGGFNLTNGQSYGSLQSTALGMKIGSDGNIQIGTSRLLGFVEVKGDNLGYTYIKTNTGLNFDVEFRLKPIH